VPPAVNTEISKKADKNLIFMFFVNL